MKSYSEKKQTKQIFNRRRFVQLGALTTVGSVTMPQFIFGKIKAKIDRCALTTLDFYGTGPFYQADGVPNTTILADINEPGERLFISGTVYREDCSTPIENVELDVWHANDAGQYDDHLNTNSYNLRGKMTTDINGDFAFETIRPGRYQIGPGTFRPEHIHIIIRVPGEAELITQLYFEGDLDNPNDPGSNDPTAQNRIIPLTQDVDGWYGIFDIIHDSSSITGMKGDSQKRGYLLQNYPNPISNSTTINFSVFQKTRANLSIFNIEGKLIKTLINQPLPPDRYQVNWDAKNENSRRVSNGVYICRLVLDSREEKNIKMIVQI